MYVCTCVCMYVCMYVSWLQVRVFALPETMFTVYGLRVLVEDLHNASRPMPLIAVDSEGNFLDDVVLPTIPESAYPASIDEGLPGFDATKQLLVVSKVCG